MTPAPLFLVVALLCAAPVLPAGAAENPNWPCAQPLVPQLTAATYWNSPTAPAATDWRADPRLAELVAAVAPRDVPIDAAVSQLGAFADATAPASRPAVLTTLFAGLVDATNAARGSLIARIEQLAARQRDLSHMATHLATEVRAAPPDAPATAELIQRRDFATRAFQEAQRTMRYACEAPATLESRLGQFARTLQARIGG